MLYFVSFDDMLPIEAETEEEAIEQARQAMKARLDEGHDIPIVETEV